MVCTPLKTATDDTIILSNYSVSEGILVQVGCREFGQRLTTGAKVVTCLSNAWSPAQTTFKCEWNGELTTYEKLIIGLSSAGGGVLLFGFLLICCLALKNRRDGETGRPEPADGYQFYSGKNPQNPSSQYDNRAFERNDYDRSSGYRDTGYQGTNYQQGKREDYRWNGQLPRAHMARDDRYNRQY